MGSSYTFGESAIASRRLRLLSEVFESTSREFLAEAVRFKPRAALDLGCGPGHTTRLIAEVLKPDRTIGVERSAAFLSEARSTKRDGVSFVEGDVVKMPLPTADVIFARFLLTHLPRPEKVMADWARQLRPGGLLLLEEVEEIRTDEPTLRRYLEIVSAMLAHHGSELHVGPRLDGMREDERISLKSSRVSRLEPTVGQAADMFSMNLANWREDEFIRDAYSEREVEELDAGLLRLAGSRARGGVFWRLRQIVIERA